jgi:hypothetical protein
MDMDDDDAFLYGDAPASADPPNPAEDAAPSADCTCLTAARSGVEWSGVEWRASIEQLNIWQRQLTHMQRTALARPWQREYTGGYCWDGSDEQVARGVRY